MLASHGVSKGYGATRLCMMYLDRQWNVVGVKTLIKKTDMTGSIDRQRGSGRPRSARTPANINEVEGLTLSQEDKPQTHSSRWKITRRKVILKVGEVVCGISSWLSARPSTSLCWQEYSHCVDDHYPAVGRYCRSCQFS